MTNLNFTLFIVPAITLLIVIALYIYFLKRTENKNLYKKQVIAISVYAFILNFIWEVSQGPLFSDYVYDFQHISFCALASVADLIMVLLLYFVFSVTLKDPFWIRNFNLFKVLSLLFIGGAGAILGEWRHLSEGNWSYTESMPVLPIIEVGLTPLLQFIVLPILIYILANAYTSK
ncbi:MAG: hypothetical protein ABJR05_16840 [Balneola sp.]